MHYAQGFVVKENWTEWDEMCDDKHFTNKNTFVHLI